VKKLVPGSVPIRELVVSIPAPRGNHCQNEEATRTEQFAISAGIALADLLRHMCEVELDRPTATRLEVDEQRPALRVEQVAHVWLSMQQLLAGGARADLTCLASQRVAEKLPSRVFEPWSSIRARNELLSSGDSVREVRHSQIDRRHTCMQPLE